MMHPKDMLAALPDALSIRMGNPPAMPHPLADRVSAMNLADIARLGGEMTSMERKHRPRAEQAVLGMGMSRSDFGAALGEAFMRLAKVRYKQFSEHRQLCQKMEVNNFNEIHFPEIRADLALKEINEMARYVAGSADVADGMVAKGLKTFGRILAISRETIVNDELELYAELFSSMGSSAGRLENQMVFEALEANPILQDGEPTFSETLGNDLTGTALTVESVGQAMAALRKQPLRRSEPANNKPRFLVVSADDEANAMQIMQDLRLDADIVASPFMTPGRWYLQADPEVAPVIHRLRLKGSDSPILVERAKKTIEFDGVRLKARADLGVVVTGRVGIVRGGAV